MRGSATLLPMLAMVAALGLSCVSRPKAVPQATPLPPAPTTRPTLSGQAVINISRGGGGLALSDNADPKTTAELLASLMQGFQQRIDLPKDAQPIDLVGEDLNGLKSLKIDVSNGVLKSSYRPRQFAKAQQNALRTIGVERFEYRAKPLHYQKGTTYWTLTAEDAVFSLLRDPSSGRSALVLTEAREGELDFAVKLADLKPMMLGGTASNAARAVFAVRDVDYSFKSDNPKSLEVELNVKSWFMYLPAGFKVYGRADVDAWCNVHLSGLRCESTDAGGAMIAGLIHSSIQKYNGRVMPLVRWPGDRIVLNDVQVQVDDSLRVLAKFGCRETSGSGS